MSGVSKLALVTIAVTIAFMLATIILIVYGIILLSGGPVNALLYLFVFGDVGILVTVIEIARRKRNKPSRSSGQSRPD